ncbi:MAG: carbohydrate ABC transporter permease [Thaumarchaeota archaeon]|nr:carbohydrate ABC transporter permease [Nitrososphaerota archaeon]
MDKGRIFAYLITIIACTLYLLPLYTMVNVSLKSPEDLIWGPVAPARRLYFNSYLQAWEKISEPFFNSIKMTVPATLISTFLGSISGLGFYRAKFKYKDLLLFLIVLGFYVPPQAVLIPLVKFLADIGLYSTIAGLVLTHVAYGMPITTLLFKNYYESIPKEILDSAEVDGASLTTLYRSILLPLSLPGFAVVSIFQFTNIWNEFLFALVLGRGRASQLVTVAIANLKGTTLAAWNVQMAGAVIGAIPVAIFYIFATKLVIKGLMAGAIKG